MKLRSLFLAVAGALLLTTALVPRANATLLIYFNFEDVAPNAVGSKIFDPASDQTAAFGGDNPGGGIQASTLQINYGPAPTPSADFSTTSSASIMGANRSVGDTDLTNNSALLLTSSDSHNGSWIQFAVDATFFANMSLSLAVNTNGNGFETQTWQFNTTGGVGAFTTFATFNNLTGLQTLSAPLPAGANQQTNLVIRVVFSGGQSNGQDLQTIIDNIQLNGTVIPEPATVVGGLLGVLGLCWFQRRRLIRCVRLRRA
jgi:hypothetical protein